MPNKIVPITGELSCATVPVVNKNIRKIIKREADITLDLSQVTSTDNSGVGLLVALAEYAKKMDKKLSFTNLPKQMLDLLEAFNAQELIKIVGSSLDKKL